MATAIEDATHISELDNTIPADNGANGKRYRGGAEVRKLKDIILTDLPNISGVVTATHTDLNKTNQLVTWNYTAKTTTFSAAANNGYFVDTTGGAFECDMPAGVEGDVVYIVDSVGNCGTAACTIDPNLTEKVLADTDLVIDIDWAAVALKYKDATSGWVFI